MSQNSTFIILSLLTISALLIFLTLDQDSPSPDEKYNIDSPVPENSNYIKPAEFKVGEIDMPVYNSANLCDTTVLKPIIPVDVDYGSKIPNDCPCTKYLQPP